MKAALGIGVVGLGEIGAVHAANVAGRIPGARLRHVADPIPARARGTAATHGCRASTSHADLLADPTVDAVVVASPPSTHAAIVEAAAAAGRHVLCEKPLADELGSAARAAQAAERAGVVLQVGFHRRFDPDFGALHERVRDGALGDVYRYASRMRNMRPPALERLLAGDTELLYEAACHELDAARWLVGEIEAVSTHAAGLSAPELERNDRVDTAVIVLRFASGAIGTIDVSHVAGYGFDCGCEIVGSAAAARLEQRPPRALTWLSPGLATVAAATTFLDRFRAAYALELEAFAEAVRDGERPRVGGADGVAALVLCDAVDAARRAGAPVRLRHRSTASGVAYELAAPAGAAASAPCSEPASEPG